jgi:methionyl-tRNA formyltransferase
VRLLFAGTPKVAAVGLRALLESEHDVVSVLTRPPSRQGRGRSVHASPVADLAAAAGIPVLTDLRDATDLIPEVDCCPVIAYGALIPESALSSPSLGWVNVHFSLLPRWRGAAPVQWAIRSGDLVTGVSIFQLDAGLDTGPILASRAHPIGPTDTSGSLLDSLGEIGASLLVETLNDRASGSQVGAPQDEAGATFAPKITSEDAHVDWREPAEVIDRLIRSCTPAPGAWTTTGGDRLRVGPVSIAEGDAAPGVLDLHDSRVLVGTGRGRVQLGDVQPAGRRMMPAADWLRGARSTVQLGT